MPDADRHEGLSVAALVVHQMQALDRATDDFAQSHDLIATGHARQHDEFFATITADRGIERLQRVIEDACDQDQAAVTA